MKSNKMLRTIYWNAQSIHEKLAEFLHFNNIKIAILSQTLLSQNHNINIHGYNIHRKDRINSLHNHKRTCGEVAIILLCDQKQTECFNLYGIDASIQLMSVYSDNQGSNLDYPIANYIGCLIYH